MNQRFTWPTCMCVSLVLGSASQLPAEHANIDLTLKGAGEMVEAFCDQEPPSGGVNKRPVLEVKSGERLEFQFFLTNIYPHARIKNVTVRYYVRRMRDAGEEKDEVKPIEKKFVETKRSARARTITAGSMVLNFKPKCRVGARLRFKAPSAGRYLVRVETAGTQSDHEHFSAVELLVTERHGTAP